MRRTHREVAHEVRASLVAGDLSPGAFRVALGDVPAEHRDAWLDVVWDLGELPDDDPRLPSGCVPYLPCPVDTVLDAVGTVSVTSEDLFVDVGSGVGRTTALVHLLTGAPTIGLEIQSELVETGRARSDTLGLRGMRFIEGDAVDTIQHAGDGSVFFMYCPFGRSRIDRVLEALQVVARRRQIHVCCVGMATLEAPWLAPVAAALPDLSIYRSR